MPNTRPNILLITTDQQHWHTLGHLNPLIRTPNLDRLADEGVLFERAYCANPVCSPSRASILTGLYPSWHGCWTIGVKLPEDVPTVSSMLGQAGYGTALIGKTHLQPLASTPESVSLECQPVLRDLDFWRGFWGPWYGFEHVEIVRNHADESHAGQHYALWLEEQGLSNWRDYFQPWPPRHDQPLPMRYWMRDTTVWPLPAELHYNTWTAERSIAWMEHCAEHEQPFFLWSSFPDPHPPYLVPEPWASMYDPEEMQPGTLLPGELDAMPPHFRLTQEQRPDIRPYLETFGPHGLGSHLLDEADLRRFIATYYGMVSFVDEQVGQLLAALQRLGQAENTLIVFTTDHGHFLGQHGLTDKGPFHYEDLLRIPWIVRWPGHVPAGQHSRALQTQVDLAPTFLEAAGVAVPGSLQGVSQVSAWQHGSAARDHVLIEDRMELTCMVLRSYVDERFKLTVYRQGDNGELFDLQEDPEERHNLWHDPASQALKSRLLLRMAQAEMQREPTRMARVAGA